MTQEEFKEKMKSILEISGENDEIADIIDVVLNDPVDAPANQEDGEWKKKYEELKDKYYKRFFDGDEKNTTVIPAGDNSRSSETISNEISSGDTEDVKNEEKTIDDLFEGDEE